MFWNGCYVIRSLAIFLAGVTPVFLLTACAHQALTVEEAKEVTMSVRRTSFVPPPRKSYDIVELLKRPNQEDSQAARKFLAQARAEPSKNMSVAQLSEFHLERGKAAFQIGLMQQTRKDFQRAFFLASSAGTLGHDVKFRLATIEYVFGNYQRTNDLAAQSARESGYISRYAYMVKHHARIGDLDGALRWRREGKQRYLDIASRYPPIRREPFTRYALAKMEAVILEARGRFQEAEPYRRTMLANFEKGSKGQMPIFALDIKLTLINNLRMQGRLVEAEIEARRAIEEAVAFRGKGTYICAMACHMLGKILVGQRRLNEARAILETAIETIKESDIPIDTPFVGDARLDLVGLMALQGAYADAAQQFDRARACFAEHRFFMGKLLFRQNVFAALIMAGRYTETLALIDDVNQELVDRLGSTHLRATLMVALRGMAQDGLGNVRAAAVDYATSLSSLLSVSVAADNNIWRHWMVRVILEAYLDSMAANRKADTHEPTLGEEVHTAFQIGEALRHSALQQAISARSARVAITDPVLKDLIRREQDARRQIEVLEVNLTNALAAPSDQIDPNLIQEVSNQLEQLKSAHQTLWSEILETNPFYADYTAPHSMSINDVQALLKPAETLLAIYATRQNTFVWGIPNNGAHQMAVVPTGRQVIADLVDRIRLSLDATPTTLGDIPAFDLAAAHRIYRLVLAPVSATWADAKELLVVTNAPLDRLPLGVLPVSDTASAVLPDDLLFAGYRRVNWLIRQTAISRHASVAAFATLRQTPVQAKVRQPFAGFGDPVFNTTAHMAGNSITNNSSGDVHVRERGLPLRVRGVRVTDSGSLDDDSIRSIRLQDLVPLPDTADEIQSIARALQAAPEASIFLGADASETRIKSMQLADRKVIAFATHALLPGDIDGLSQPALALSAPDVTRGNEDGLLTMGEIMMLHLDADWVVLSACNSGSGDGAGAEAISGLGLAFFYAGSRALLVSLWPVETTSAKHLTTGIFTRQQADPRLGRARALQTSILALMDSPGLVDPTTDTIAASYAHPLFWGPFILVGEGAAELGPATQ
jgi:CHAT domain-containing protein